jgi:hypothetical protein
MPPTPTLILGLTEELAANKGCHIACLRHETRQCRSLIHCHTNAAPYVTVLKAFSVHFSAWQLSTNMLFIRGVTTRSASAGAREELQMELVTLKSIDRTRAMHTICKTTRQGNGLFIFRSKSKPRSTHSGDYVQRRTSHWAFDAVLG